MRCFAVLSLILAFGVSACNDEQKPADTNNTSGADPIRVGNYAPASEMYYQCGDQVVEFLLLEGNRADMRIANMAFAMQQVTAASGAKYENIGHSATFFWNKGAEVLVAVNGEHLPLCVQIDEPVEVKPYKAVGNEPGWQAVVEKGRLELTLDYGEKNASLPVTSDKETGEGRVIEAAEAGQTALINIQHQPCADSMSGEPFAHKVQVDYNGQTYAGCGESLIRDITFRLQNMSAGEVVENSTLTLIFGFDGRLAGNAGCNQYGGSYSLEGETLYVHPDLISTMRACVDERLMQQEQRFLATLPTMTAARLERGGQQLTLTNEKGEHMVFGKEQ